MAYCDRRLPLRSPISMTDNTITYLNTDLCLRASPVDPAPLVSALEVRSISKLYCTREDDGLWYATLETERSHQEPETNIAEIVAALEGLDEPLRALWHGFALRQFVIGYDCGAEPWAFEQGISAALLGRIAALDASLRITLYPDRSSEEETPPP